MMSFRDKTVGWDDGKVSLSTSAKSKDMKTDAPRMPPALDVLSKIDTKSENPEMQTNAEDLLFPSIAKNTPIKHTYNCQMVNNQYKEEEQVSPTVYTRIGAVIKKQEKEMHTIPATPLTPAQIVYSITGLELMTMVEFLRKYQVQI